MERAVWKVGAGREALAGRSFCCCWSCIWSKCRMSSAETTCCIWVNSVLPQPAALLGHGARSREAATGI